MSRFRKSFQKQINEKRIDAVIRLADKLKTLKSSTEKNITKKSLANTSDSENWKEYTENEKNHDDKQHQRS